MNKADAQRSSFDPMEASQIAGLRIMSVIEGSTLLVLLLIAVPLKHLAGIPLVSTIVGPIHGLVFLAYIWTVIETVSGGGWSRAEILRLLIVAFVPFGSYTNHAFLNRKFLPAAQSLTMKEPVDVRNS